MVPQILHPCTDRCLVLTEWNVVSVFDQVGEDELRLRRDSNRARSVVCNGDLRVDDVGCEPEHVGDNLRIALGKFDGLEDQAFLDAIAMRVPPLTDGRSGLRVLQVLGAAQRSLMLNGEPITL